MKFSQKLIFLFLLILTAVLLNKVWQEKIELLKKEKYIAVTQEIQEQTNILVEEKKNATVAIGVSLSFDKTIKEALKKDKVELIKLGELSASLRKNSDFKNVWFHVLTGEGKCFYRSWTDRRCDTVLNNRIDIEEMLKDPKIMTTISVGNYDMTFKVMIPIYEEKNLLGIIEVITHFNSITIKLLKKGIEPVVLADKKYKEQLLYPFTKLFIGNYYVANLNANPKYMDIIEEKTVEHFLTFEKIYNEDIERGNIETLYTVPDIKGDPLGYIILFKPINEIDMSDIEWMKEEMVYYIVILLILSASIFYYLTNRRVISAISSKNRSMKKLNDYLEKALIEEKEAQRQQEKERQILFQQSKMAAMGEMIGNIAHQWRQPITIISMWANNIIADIDIGDVENKELRKYAVNINEQTQHLSQTIDDFRNFFIPNKDKSIFTIKSSIDKTMSLLSAAFKTHGIELIEDIEDIEIVALENELTQAILNIIKNAKDVLETRPDGSRKLIFINVYKKDNKAIIEIKDSGGGIADNIIDKVFEPYFTTKHKSQGTGIGLYMTESIITKHLHGEITAENSEYEYEGKHYMGAMFTIALPIDEKR
ncbi:GHKL domain-containing protein [Candidatus Sulfurimonas marisnigri]|uniref:histidine kinase n=1 Tax=Candidatus Sulfurimonas marisnigri TaxID=2740405 RepID=A0A7S7M0J2_9BACT|nr:ATP-binding protein [Candidatus Sulfurimonas marisnigri]QOY54826.1 GHKL domain-containing protein [Candidatus Sulfurimonas marisnigri]